MSFRKEDGTFLRRPEKSDFGLDENPIFRIERSDEERKGVAEFLIDDLMSAWYKKLFVYWLLIECLL